jgi:hypothetical protein
MVDGGGIKETIQFPTKITLFAKNRNFTKNLDKNVTKSVLFIESQSDATDRFKRYPDSASNVHN